jgi:hypothetical protein
MVSNYESQQRRLEAYNHSHFVFSDGTKIEWTPDQQAKALQEARIDALKLGTLAASIQVSLGL